MKVSANNTLLSEAEVGRLLKHNECLRSCLASVVYIKDCYAKGDLYEALEAWIELTEEEQTALYIAPSKGGIFTTEERAAIKNRFRE